MYGITRSVFRQFLTCIICDILIADNGFHEGWSAPMLPKFGTTDPIVITDDQSTLIVNLLYIGTGVGAIFLFFIMNRVGRKTILLCAAVPKMLSWLLFALANSYTTIYIARFSAGLSHGVTFTVLSIYQCEITSKHIRGVVGAVMSEIINFSVLLVYIIGLWLSRFNMSIIGLVIQLSFFVTFMICPESPYFLVRKNKEADATKVLKWLLNQEDVLKELEQIKRIVAIEDAFARVSLITQVKEIFRKKENRRAALIAAILATALTWCGSVPVCAYQSYTYMLAGFPLSKNVSIMLTGCANLLGGFVCIATIRKFGKRLILLISLPIICLSLTVVALFFYLLERQYDVQDFRWVPTVFLVVYIFAYGFSLYPLVYTYMGEIFPYEMKTSAAISFAIFFSVSSVSTVQCYQALRKYGLNTPFWFFSAITVIMWVLIYIYVPETEHKSLEDILMELRSDKTPYKNNKSDCKANEKSVSNRDCNA